MPAAAAPTPCDPSLTFCEIAQRTPEEQVAAAIPYLRKRAIL